MFSIRIHWRLHINCLTFLVAAKLLFQGVAELPSLKNRRICEANKNIESHTKTQNIFSAHPIDPVPKCHKREAKEKTKKAAKISNKRIPSGKMNLENQKNVFFFLKWDSS